MATNAEILASLQTAAATMRAGGLVESYTLPNGLSVKVTNYKDLEALIAQYSDSAAADAGSSAFRLARTRPRE